MTIANDTGLNDAHWIGQSPTWVPEFWPPEFDDRPNITRDMEPVRLLRTRFHVAGELARATLSITARGIYVTSVDGVKVGDEELAPGFTDYARRIQVQTVDVTALLPQGDHVWGIELADGWFAGYLGMDRRHQAGLFGSTTSARGALTLEYADGRREVVTTNPDWRMGEGEIRYADLLMGQFTDFTATAVGWNTLAFDDSGFAPVYADSELDVELVPQAGPPVRVTDVLPALTVTPLDDSRVIVDFGQNLVGRVRLALPGGVAGTRVHVRHGEAIEADGELYTVNLRTVRAHDIVVTGEAAAMFEPAFTFHGFRYVEVRGYPGELTTADIQAVVIGSDVPRVGSFACSSPDLEQLERNIAWTVRGNLLSVPTDCPQRDERLGWMGDAQLIMATANHAFDLSGFIAKWLVDIRDGQSEAGAYPDVAPRTVVPVDGSPGWADAGVLVPWRTYLFTGELSLLADHYDSMVRFMNLLESENPQWIREHGLSRNYGDWLSLSADTPKVLLATAYWKLSVDAMAGASRALGLDDARWVAAASAISATFAERFVAEDGTVGAGTQTGYALALDAGLVPADRRAAAAAHLVADIRSRGTELSTGIHGLRALMPALADNGYLDVAFELLERDTYPSWLYPIRQGATTVWERWDGCVDGQFQTPAMNSLNHYALGSVGEWLYGYLGGLRPASAGFELPVIQPFPGGSLTNCSVSRSTADGEISASWTHAEDAFELTVNSPGGALVKVPTSDEGGARGDNNAVGLPGQGWDTFIVGPGEHRFQSTVRQDWVPGRR